ncbi:MAG: glycoside hydrolase family 5 protein [Vulcanimicrobiota bacterium]
MRLFVACWALLLLSLPALGEPGFWDQPRRGANGFLTHPTEEWFAQAHQAGLEWVRLSPANWPAAERDFLVGDADHYQGIPKADLALLKEVLGWAEQHHVKVVLTQLTLPGARYRQHNGNRYDDRIWQDAEFRRQAAAFWRDLARELHGNPAIVAYNLLNEPAPELGTGLPEYGTTPDDQRHWYAQHRGTGRDLPAFYNQVIAAIREVDPDTPIMLDAGWYSQPMAFTAWPSFEDDNLLYDFHSYEPSEFVSRLNFREHRGYVYPGRIPYAGREMQWDKATLRGHLQPFFDWAKQRSIPTSRLVAGEFGCFRRNPGCAQYLADSIDIFEEHGIHWAFYGFREDGWEGMDYEVGPGPLGPGYWEAVEAGQRPPLERGPNPLWNAIQARLPRR